MKLVCTIFILALLSGCGVFDDGPAPLTTGMTLNEDLELEGYESATGSVTLKYTDGLINVSLAGFPEPPEGREFRAKTIMLDEESVDFGDCHIEEDGTHHEDHPFATHIGNIAVVHIVLTDAIAHEHEEEAEEEEHAHLKTASHDHDEIEGHDDEEAEEEDHDADAEEGEDHEDGAEHEDHDSEGSEDVVILSVTIQEADAGSDTAKDSDEEGGGHMH